MTSIAEAFVTLRPDLKGFESEASTGVTGSVKKLAGVAAGAMVAAGAVSFLKGSIEEAREAARVTKLTEAVIASTGGAAHVSAGQVSELAEALSRKAGIDDEVIQSAENVLLTFTKVRNEAGKGNDIFNQTTAAALDMSVALGTDLQGSTLQLGKALNDPIKGMTALTRSGVSFTQQQKDQVKAMVEAGDTLGAQKLILSEMQVQFGGAAAAAADPMQKLGVVIGNLKERLGTALLPIISSVANTLSTVLPAALSAASTAFRTLMAVVTPVFDFLMDNKEVLAGLAVGIMTLLIPAIAAKVVALGAWATAAWAAAAAQIALHAPVIAIAAAIAALVAGVIWAYQNWDWFREAVDKVAQFFTGVLWPALQTVAGWIAGTLVPIIASVVWWFADKLGPVVTGVAGFFVNTLWPALQTVAGFLMDYVIPAVVAVITKWVEFQTAIATVVVAVIGKIGEIVTFVIALPGKIGSAVAGMWDKLKEGLQAAIDWIVKQIDRALGPIDEILGKLGAVNRAAPGALGGGSGSGNWAGDLIPKGHMGGMFRTATPGGEGMALLRDRETITTPEDAGAQLALLADIKAAILRQTDKQLVIARTF